MKPDKLYHVTTFKKLKKYREGGCIRKPVRGFDTLIGAMAWAIKTNRKLILELDLTNVDNENIHKLPDHHNKWGTAWWIDEDFPCESFKCVYSPEKV